LHPNHKATDQYYNVVISSCTNISGKIGTFGFTRDYSRYVLQMKAIERHEISSKHENNNHDYAESGSIHKTHNILAILITTGR